MTLDAAHEGGDADRARSYRRGVNPDLSINARAVAERLASSLAQQGARAVAVVGSYARGDATAGSDLDVAVVGRGPQSRLETDDALLVSVGWATEFEQRRRLYDPAYLGTHVPGWRQAIPVRDPEGIVDSLKREAVEWSWNEVEELCAVWVAERVTGYADEVHKLVATLSRGEPTTAAVQRSRLATHLASVLAIRRQILYGSESRLWELLSPELGASWREAQAAALGLGGESLDLSCRAALRLFALAAREVRPLLDERQLAVVEQALQRDEALSGIPSSVWVGRSPPEMEGG